MVKIEYFENIFVSIDYGGKAIVKGRLKIIVDGSHFSIPLINIFGYFETNPVECMREGINYSNTKWKPIMASINDTLREISPGIVKDLPKVFQLSERKDVNVTISDS